MIRAGVSGTNWTGKSEAIRTFIERNPDVRADTVVLSDLLRRCPHPTVAEQTPETSRWMVEELVIAMNRNVEADVQFFDRTPIDILAFTQYAFDREGHEIDTELMATIHKLIDGLDLIFHAPISDEWPMGVSVAPRDVAFALLMDRYIQQVIRRYKIPVINLPWPRLDRQRVLREHLRS